MKTAIIILAAGNSSRMKAIKQLLPLGNNTLLGLTIENALKATTDEVYCVLGANADNIQHHVKQYNVKFIRNLNYEDGLGSSIGAGINHIQSLNIDAVLIMLGDQPKVSTSYLNEMFRVFKENQNHIIASDYSGKNGVPAIFPKTYFEDLLRLAGDKGAGELLNKSDASIKTITNSVSLDDIDTPEDYQNLITNDFSFRSH